MRALKKKKKVRSCIYMKGGLNWAREWVGYKEKTVRPKFVETIAYRVMRKRQVNDQTKADFVPSFSLSLSLSQCFKLQ